MNGAAAKNLAMLLATKTYRGINSIGRAIRKVPSRMIDKMEKVHKMKEERNVKMIEENWGNVENYNKLQK